VPREFKRKAKETSRYRARFLVDDGFQFCSEEPILKYSPSSHKYRGWKSRFQIRFPDGIHQSIQSKDHSKKEAKRFTIEILVHFARRA
jgi:hypothetical protein